MSGRGVITSRTSVPPKSTIDCSSAALLPLDQALLLAGFEVGVRRLPAPPPRGVAAGCVRAARAAASDDQPDQRAGQRMQEPRGDVERRQQHCSARSGLLPHDQHRQHVLADAG